MLSRNLTRWGSCWGLQNRFQFLVLRLQADYEIGVQPTKVSELIVETWPISGKFLAPAGSSFFDVGRAMALSARGIVHESSESESGITHGVAARVIPYP